MTCCGEVRVYVGGRWELHHAGELMEAVWIQGNMVMKQRYHNKGIRSAIIKKALDAWGEIEVVVRPDEAFWVSE